MASTKYLTPNVCPMEWTNPHDIALCREIILVNPFKAKKKTIPRAKLLEEVATNVNKMDTIEFNTSQRGVRDRYMRISNKFRARMVEEQRASGISPETSELDVFRRLAGRTRRARRFVL